jgi:DNA-binding transcriptional ArsR family regulator/ubiquinone/menaquinone biosynthesis C-methylase UbiE
MLANEMSPLDQPALVVPPVAIDDLASLCKAAGDQLRLEILQVLRQDSLAVQELCAIFEIRQPAMSHHLKVLAAAGAVTSRREGNSIYYRRAVLGQQPALDAVQSVLFAAIDQMPLTRALQQQLSTVQQARENTSQLFFRQNADKFRAQQDLIASYEQYGATVAEVLQGAPLQSHGLALEVGPGDGAFLSQLAGRFEQVVALDNAAEMLAKSEHTSTASGIENIEFVHGDTRHPRLQSLVADCIVVNMVLHHTPSPADIFQDLANCLAKDGVLLVTDLCQHDQDWARENCGDLWLGFEPEDLLAWAERAGLREVASVYLAQRNGFQIQVRLFGHRLISNKENER